MALRMTLTMSMSIVDGWGESSSQRIGSYMIQISGNLGFHRIGGNIVGIQNRNS